MSSELEQARADLKTSEDTGDRQREYIAEVEKRRDALEALVEALEADVARLEAEGLQPLVDRLRMQIGAMRALLVAMADAIATLTGGELTGATEAIEEAIEEVIE